MWVYYHRLFPHELGFRGGKPRGAGAMLYLKKEACDGRIFPALSEERLNPSQAIELRSPDFFPTVGMLVYNNDRVVGKNKKTKGEYRLNLNWLARKYPHLFSAERIARIKPHPEQNKVVFLQFLEERSEEHSEIESLLNELPKRRGKHQNHLMIESDPLGNSMPEAKIGEPRIAENVKKKLLKELLGKGMTDPERPKKIGRGHKTSRDPAFRPFVMEAYGNRCAFSGVRIAQGLKNSLEAAHIYPVEDGGSDNPKNGLALSRDLHWAFDNGAISVAEDLTLMVHEEWESFEVPGVEVGKKIFLPEDSRLHPFEKALAYHRESIYGSFDRGLG